MESRMDEAWTLNDSLASVCADLLSQRQFEPFVRSLFAGPSGAWRKVADLCGGLAQLPPLCAELFAGHGEVLMVTHLPWPGPECDGFSLVLFVHHGELWSTIAAYNRQRLERAGLPVIGDV
jgi:hypothetical protein